MSKLLLPTLCLCLAAWLFGGSVWFSNQYAKGTADSSWTLQDGINKFTSSTLFSFQKSDPEIFLDDNQHAMIGQIAEYLDTHKDRHLELTGFYTETEINDSDYDNLGQARAQNFLYLIQHQGVDLDQLHAFSKLVKKHRLNSNGLIDGGVEFNFVESPLVKYGNTFSLNKVILFKGNSETDLAITDFDTYIASLRQYLTDHPDKKIKLIGYSNSVDQNKLTRKRVFNLEKSLKKLGLSKDKLSSTLESTAGGNNANSYIEIRIF